MQNISDEVIGPDYLNTIIEGIRITMSIEMRSKHKDSAAPETLSPEKVLTTMFRQGQGCNLTLYNANVRREEDLSEIERSRVSQRLSNGLNNSSNSFSHD